MVAPGQAFAQAFEPNDTVEQASGPLEGGRDYDGGIETSNDRDYFYFNTSGQRQLDISLFSRSGTGCDSPDLLDAEGNFVAGSSFSGNTARLLYTSPGAEQYVLRVDGSTSCLYRLRVDPPSALTSASPGITVVFGDETTGDDTQTLTVDGRVVASISAGTSRRFDLGNLPATTRIAIDATNTSGRFAWDFAVTNLVGRRQSTFLSETQSGGTASAPRIGTVRRVVIDPAGALIESCGELIAPTTCIPPPPPPPPPPPVDSDRDGFPVGTDCNDADANVRPSAAERPDNAVDENCDGLVARRARQSATVGVVRSGRRYVGRVRSSPSFCVSSRTVKLRRRGSRTKSFGTARTDSAGRYVIRRSSRLGGRLYVVVTEKANAGFVCRVAASRVFRG